MGADSICIKDMAGLISPYAAYELVSKLKAILGVPVQLHSHCTSGMASMSYLKAAEAGVDVVDTAISVMALQTSQPPTESIVGALQGQQRDTGLDLLLLKEIAEFYREVRKKYCEHEGGLVGVDTDVFLYQVPGGMFSNLTSQLREQKALHRLPEVLAELPRVRADLGYPPLVTPTSQIVGVQAVYNVLMGKPYRFVSNEVKAYLRGQYGRPPGPVNEEVRKMVLKGADVIDGRPADVLEPELGKAAVELGDLALSEEDVLSGALFPQVAKEFLQKRAEGKAVDLRAMAESVLANDTQQDRLSLCR